MEVLFTANVLTFTSPLLNESRLNTAVPRSRCASGRAGVCCGWLNRLETVALARRAWAATGISLSGSSSGVAEHINPMVQVAYPYHGATHLHRLDDRSSE